MGMRRKLLKIKELCIALRRKDAEDVRAWLLSDLCASASLCGEIGKGLAFGLGFGRILGL
jgi:predicted nucleic acid-binding protein